MTDDDARKIIAPLERASRERYDAVQKDLRNEAVAELGCIFISLLCIALWCGLIFATVHVVSFLRSP